MTHEEAARQLAQIRELANTDDDGPEGSMGPRWILGQVREILDGDSYVCAGCKRRVPNDFGAADDMPDHCDDCWAAAHGVEEGRCQASLAGRSVAFRRRGARPRPRRRELGSMSTPARDVR